MKYIIIILSILISLNAIAEEKPLTAVIINSSSQPIDSRMSRYITKHINRLLNNTGEFTILNSRLLTDQLIKFRCLDEQCFIRFAKKTGIKILIKGTLINHSSYYILRLKAYGTDAPYFGKVIHSRSVKITLLKKYSVREYSYISEEQAGIYISKFLNFYKRPQKLIKSKSAIWKISPEKIINGKHTIYRIKNNIMQEVTSLHFKNNSVPSIGNKASLLKEGDFILVNFKTKSQFYDKFYYGRKKEIVISEPNFYDPMLLFLFTIPASASMPLAAPILGYFNNSDWNGFLLWTANVWPYLYLEIDGLVNGPYTFENNGITTMPHRSVVHWYYSMYMVFMGGMSLFVDSFAHKYLRDAASYAGIQPMIGNSIIAGYLALISGGGGHFYRGSRFWGYFYYHINNVLFYFILQEFLADQTYNSTTKQWVQNESKISSATAWTLVGIYAGIKIIEIVHAVLMRDDIQNGEVIDDKHFIEPVIKIDQNAQTILGLRYNYRF